MSFLPKYFEKFQLAKYHLSLKAEEKLTFPAYKGATLRGGFGSIFHRLCCIDKKRQSCKECPLQAKCAYAYIFVTRPPRDSKVLRNLSDIPRPFVVEPPEDSKREYEPEEVLVFNLLLFGTAISYLPYFIFAFKELGKAGVGKSRGTCQLIHVSDYKNRTVYDSSDDVIRNVNSVLELNNEFSNFIPKNNILTLYFITPVRIKFRTQLVARPDFHILVRSLLHRISALSYFHCGVELKIDYKSLITEAEKVKIKTSYLKWYDWERYSSRQGTRMRFGGLVGKVTYEGDFMLFLPLLVLGQYTHIGKNCTFGLGSYRIVKEEKN